LRACWPPRSLAGLARANGADSPLSHPRLHVMIDLAIERRVFTMDWPGPGKLAQEHPDQRAKRCAPCGDVTEEDSIGW